MKCVLRIQFRSKHGETATLLNGVLPASSFANHCNLQSGCTAHTGRNNQNHRPPRHACTVVSMIDASFVRCPDSAVYCLHSFVPYPSRIVCELHRSW